MRWKNKFINNLKEIEMLNLTCNVWEDDTKQAYKVHGFGNSRVEIISAWYRPIEESHNGSTLLGKQLETSQKIQIG